MIRLEMFYIIKIIKNILQCLSRLFINFINPIILVLKDNFHFYIFFQFLTFFHCLYLTLFLIIILINFFNLQFPENFSF